MGTPQTTLQAVVEHVRELTKATDTRTLAAQILRACLLNRYVGGSSSPFQESGETVIDANELWTAGDLAIGRGGPEFNYVYSPIRFVEQLFSEALRLTSEPVVVSSGKRRTKHQLGTKTAGSLAKTYTIEGTIYLLNNLRAKLNEAIEDLFVEAGAAMTETHKVSLNSVLNEIITKQEGETDDLRVVQSQFRDIIDDLMTEGNKRKRVRLKAAFWEIDPVVTLIQAFSTLS